MACHARSRKLSNLPTTTYIVYYQLYIGRCIYDFSTEKVKAGRQLSQILDGVVDDVGSSCYSDDVCRQQVGTRYPVNSDGPKCKLCMRVACSYQYTSWACLQLAVAAPPLSGSSLPFAAAAMLPLILVYTYLHSVPQIYFEDFKSCYMYQVVACLTAIYYYSFRRWLIPLSAHILELPQGSSFI